MKKSFLFIMLFVLSFVFLFSNTIRVTEPNANVYKRSDTLHIRWVLSGISGNVKIVLRKADGSGGITIVKNYPASRLFFNYKLTNINPGRYFVKVKQGKIFGKSSVFRVENNTNNTNGIQMIDTKSLYRPRVNEPVSIKPEYQIKPLTIDPNFSMNKYGKGCPGNSGCSIRFINKTQLSIVALNIKRLDNNKVENPIVNFGQVIPPGGYLNISEFYDKKYVYQAFYGTWNKGAARPNFSTRHKNSPVSQVFMGTARTVQIIDPNATAPTVQFPDAVKKLTVYKAQTDWNLVWMSYSKCSNYGGICTDILRLRNNGEFEYWERGANSAYHVVSKGKFIVTAYNKQTKIISFKLLPKGNNASFSIGLYSYSNTGIRGRMSLAIDVNTTSLGKRTACFGCM
jgi:hypothetical protein